MKYRFACRLAPSFCRQKAEREHNGQTKLHLLQAMRPE